MELLEALALTFDHAARVVAGVQPDQLDGATTCRDWDVRALVAHMTGVVMNMGRGASGAELLADINAVPVEPDFGTQFRGEADRTLAAWVARGLDGEVNVGAVPMPARVGIGINVFDTATHSWDIARATGQDADLPDEVAVAALAACQGIVNDDIRKFAGFDPAVSIAGDASPTEQLVAYLGRQP